MRAIIPDLLPTANIKDVSHIREQQQHNKRNLKKQRVISFKNLIGENMEENEGCTHSIKTADENICGECEQEYTEHETADWIYMWRM